MPKMAIIYGSGLGRTRKMAEAIAEGAKTVGGVDIVLKDAYDADMDDIKDADAVLLGGSTYNYRLIKAMDPVLEKMKGLDLMGKVCVAFGSHGWSGEGATTILKRMQSFGMNVVEPPITAIHVPDAAALEKCFMMGRTVAQAIKG